MMKRDTRRIKLGNEMESDWGEDSVITLASSEDVTLNGWAERTAGTGAISPAGLERGGRGVCRG